ncbi:MAG TPA: polysaccharide biosynthesis tyrosine autokinase, partial [bacterium]|nr:polysaccharide biosynthesis tyrosine autokinase [bacterium]
LIKSPRLVELVLKKIGTLENRHMLLDCFDISPSGPRGRNDIFSDKERSLLAANIQRSLNASQVERARIISISVTGFNPAAVALIANAVAESYVEMNYESHVQSFKQSFSMISKSLSEIREKIKTGEIAIEKVDSEIKLFEALKHYEEKHPTVIKLRKEIPVLSEKLSQGVQNIKTMPFSQRKDLIPLLMEPHTEMRDLTAIETDLYSLKPILEQEVNTNREMYNSMFKRLQEVEITEGNIWVDAKIVEPASVPGRPFRPNKKMNLILSFVVGVFIGIGLTFFLEYLDSSIRSLDDVSNYLKLFSLGMVPQVEFVMDEEEKEIEKRNPVFLPRPFWLANDIDIPLYVAEAYRIIRTNLAFGAVDTSLKVLQVTSAVKGEGKTTTSANLGISLAQAGIKTLLVDADMRKPSLHRILGLQGIEEGFSAILANGKTWESVIEPTRTPNLFCIPAGAIPPNPAELLSSNRLKMIIEELRGHFDMVIFDSPPVVSVADSSVVASRVDGVILVSRSGFIPRHLSMQAKRSIESVNGRIIGCVLNSIQSQHQPYYYYRYYNKYGDYYGENQKKKKKYSLSKELSPIIEKTDALKAPLAVFLATAWKQFLSILKGTDRIKKESKTPRASQ